jgi:ribosomal protein S18 acetylase RimI-like enzyme
MELIPLKSLTSHSMHELFSEERVQWADKLLWEYSEPLNRIGSMLDLGALPGFAMVQEGSPLGYTYYLESEGVGFVGGCFVKKDHAGEGIEERLLNEVVKLLQKNPSIRRIESQFVNFTHWPIKRLFESRGFRAHERYFMLRACDDETLTSRDSIEFRPWKITDLEDAARITVEAYQGLVDREISSHYQSIVDCRNYLSNLVLRPGCGFFLEDASFVVWDQRTRHLVGYILTSQISSNCGHIPQIVVGQSLQGKGIGAALLNRAIANLFRKGIQSVSLIVSEANEPAIRTYRKQKFQVHFPFQAFVWER